jgi:hypothetical protein
MSNFSYNVTLTPANVATFGLTSVAPSLPKVFPNGNSLSSSKVDVYVDRYNTFLCKSADAFIGLGETLVEAKEKLSNEDFTIFLEKTGLNNSKSTYSKLMKIGENAPRLRPYVDNLPQNWTTIYALSKLEANQFEKIVPHLNAYSTAKDLAVLTEAKVEKKDAPVADLTIFFGDLDLDTKQRAFAAIKDLEAQYRFGLKVRAEVTKELVPETIKAAA